MDLNKLRTFTVVAECGNISVAAEKLYRSQPAISNQIKDLEAELQLRLFERKNSRIYLTREGRVLFEKAKAHINDLENSVLRLKSAKQGVKGTLRIVVERDVLSIYLPALIGGFKQEYPDVEFEILTSTFEALDDLLLADKVDFAFSVLSTKKDFFHSHPILTFTRSLSASVSLRDKFGELNSITDILGCTFIGYYNHFSDIQFWLRKNGFAKEIPLFKKHSKFIVVQDAFTLNQMLFDGVGIGLAFDEIAKKYTGGSAPLIPLFENSEPMYITVDLSYKKVRNEGYLNQAFREFVLAKFS
ncbi:MAG: hypothetical protein COA42_16420 [Alteromonadaceae bacterium]|nr:MAG: hypothetical protein COA42_16420 [Alteromonadaceae bacterium]